MKKKQLYGPVQLLGPSSNGLWNSYPINAAIKVILGILSLRDFKISSSPNVRHVLGSFIIE